MSLNKRIISLLVLIFTFKLLIVGGFWVLFKHYKEVNLKENLRKEYIHIDPKLLESIKFHHSLKDYSVRDLIAYQMYEKYKIAGISFVDFVPEMGCERLKEGGVVCYQEASRIIDSYIPLNIDTEPLGYLKVSRKHNERLGSSRDFKIILGVLVVSLIFFSLVTLVLWFKIIRPEVNKLLEALESGKVDDTVKYSEFDRIQRTIVKALKKNEEVEVRLARGKIVNQVIHDIRSPLTSLDYFLGSIKMKLSDEENLILNKGLERIEDILGSLNENQNLGKSIDSYLVETLVADILGEKRLELSSRQEVDIRKSSELPFGTFVFIHKGKFSRALSNILNNSIEAKVQKRELLIEVKTKVKNGKVSIVIEDNGIGIPKENLSKVFGNSFGKSDGKGLGLSYAKEIIEEAGGEIRIESSYLDGTRIEIILPESPRPDWFAEDIKIKEEVVLVDDNSSLYDLWKKVLGPEASIKYYSDPESFLQNLKSTDISQRTFLIDFEFSGKKLNGIDLFKEVQSANAYLVTSHFENKNLQREVLKLGGKILPKQSISKVPLSRTSDCDEIILIDDDKFIHLSWKLAAKKKNILIHSYYSVESFLRDNKNLSKQIPIFLDNYFEGQDVGVLRSKEIVESGFHHISLISEEKSIILPEWIHSRASKRFPF